MRRCADDHTYMLAGGRTFKRLSARSSAGFMLSTLRGQVDITSGKFVFSASEAYLIEDVRSGLPSRARH